MTRKLFATTLALALCSAGAIADNLIFNPSFELGATGTGFIKILQLDSNPKQLYEAPVVDGSTSSLRIPNRFAEKCELSFKEFRLKPGAQYTFSAAMRGSIPKLKVNVSVTSATTDKSWGWDGKSSTFDVGTAWSRKAFTFKTCGPWPNEWYLLRVEFGKEKDAPAGDLWLDDVQIVEGKSDAYVGSGALEAAASVERTYYITEGGTEEAKAVLKVHNDTKAALDAKLRVTAVEDSVGVKAFSKDFAISLKPGEARQLPFALPLDRFGAYRLETELVDGTTPFASHPGFVAMAGRYERRPLDIGKSFCVGLNVGAATYVMPPDRGVIAKPGFRCDGRSADERLRLLADMGCRLARDWGESMFRWRYCEPKEGTFDFSGVDRTLDLYARHGMSVLPLLGHGDFIEDTSVNGPSWPAWLNAKCVKVEKSGDWKRPVMLPPLDLWRRYVRDVVAHCEGKVGYYEITNEPNGWLAPSVYVDYLNAANEEIKRADPTAKTVGFCSTGDLGGNMEGFLGSCYKLGGLKYADIVSFHPYDAPNLGSVKGADRQIEEAKHLVKQYGEGKNIPLWNTEVYYLRGTFGSQYIESEKHAPYHVAWRFLTDLGEGVAQECFLDERQIFKNLLSPHFAAQRLSQEAPSGDFVVLNALARHFEGAKPVDKIRWGNDSVCYVYERDGKNLAAFWSYGEMKGLKLKLPAKASDVRLFDMFGNELPFPEGGALRLGAEPFYLEAKEGFWLNPFSGGMDKKDFVAMLKAGVVEAELPVEAGAAARLVPTNGGWALVVSFRNCSGRDLAGKLGVQGEGLVGLEGVDFVIPANGELAMPVPVKLKGDKPGKVSAKFAVDGRRLDLPLNVEPQAKVLRPGEPARVGPSTMRMERDGKALKLHFDVKDASPSADAAGREPWEQDCVELFLDADPLANPVKYPGAYHGKVARLFIIPYAPEGQQLSVKPGELDLGGVKVSTATKAGGYTAELEIPLAALNGDYVGFEAQIDDADSVRRHSSANWNSAGDAYKNRNSFGFMALK